MKKVASLSKYDGKFFYIYDISQERLDAAFRLSIKTTCKNTCMSRLEKTKIATSKGRDDYFSRELL